MSFSRFGHDAEQFEQAGYGPGAGFNPEDLIREMFGFGAGGMGGMGGMGGNPFGGMGGMGGMGGGDPQADSRPRQGADVSVSLSLTFMEAVTGCSKVVSVRAKNPCKPCDGSGVKPGTKPTTCSKCGGTGMLHMLRGMFQIAAACPTCNGSGKKSTPCGTCHGESVTSEVKKVAVTVPPGVDSSTNLRLLNQGDAGFKNGPRGHLWVKTKVEPHDRFRREGFDIHVDVPLPVTTAMLGGYVEVPTLTSTVNVRVQPGAQPGDTQVMRNKGVKHLSGSQYGHQFIHFNVSVPKKMSARAVSLVEELHKELYPEASTSSSSSSGSGSSKKADDKKAEEEEHDGEAEGEADEGDDKSGKKRKGGLFSKLKSWGHKDKAE